MPKRLLMILALLAAFAVVHRAAPALAADTHVEKDGAKHDDHDDHDHDDGHGHGKEGLMDFHVSRIIWTIALFGILCVLLYMTAWKNVLTGLKKREELIRQDIADAEAARLKSEALLKEYNAQLATADAKVREIIGSAHAQAEKLAADIRLRATQDAEDAKNRATREIDSAKKQAISEIYERAADLSTSIAEKILRRNINPDDQRDLVRQSLEQLQDVK
jgi:F-type H+-transporting ATPase subunit b